MSVSSIRIHLVVALSLFLAIAGDAAAQQPGIRAPLQAPNERKPASDFSLQDASGKIARLKNYHGKVLLLDFWATWCTGCKREIRKRRDKPA